MNSNIIFNLINNSHDIFAPQSTNFEKKFKNLRKRENIISLCIIISLNFGVQICYYWHILFTWRGVAFGQRHWGGLGHRGAWGNLRGLRGGKGLREGWGQFGVLLGWGAFRSSSLEPCFEINCPKIMIYINIFPSDINFQNRLYQSILP